MNNTSAAITSLENATGSSMIVPSKTEGIALCSAFTLAFVMIVVGNLVTIVLFALNKTLRKKSLFLVINMAFADLMLGTVSLPIYIYQVGAYFQLWTGGWPMSLSVFFLSADTIFSQASLISAAFISGERFYAVYWPFKNKLQSMRAYSIVIFVAWTLALLFSVLWVVLQYLYSPKHAVYTWTSYTLILIFIISGCNIAIWRKFQQGRIASQQQNRASQNKRLTKTLLFVSFLNLMSWLPLTIVNCLIFLFNVEIPWRFYFLVNVVNYSNSFVNPVVYALRIPEFRAALILCCTRTEATLNDQRSGRRINVTASETPTTQLRTLQADLSSAYLAFESDFMDTKL